VPLHRRAVVALGVGLVGLTAAGCDDSDGAGPGQPTQPPVDADSALVNRIAGALLETAATARTIGAAVPALADVGDRLSRLHTRHARELGDTDDPAPSQVNGSRAVLQRRLWRAEQRLQERLVQATLDAESGALAQLLASMAAAVAQHREQLA